MRIADVRLLVLAALAAAALAACSGGSRSSVVSAPSQPAATAGTTLTFTIPAPTQSVQRGAKTIPAGTTSIVIGYQGQVGSTPPAFSFGQAPPSTIVIVATVSIPSSACVLQSNGSYQCSVSVTLPVGVIDLYIEAFSGPNGTGSLLASSLTLAQVNPNGSLTVPGTNTPAVITSPFPPPVPQPQPTPGPVAVSPNFLQFTASVQRLSVQEAQTGGAYFRPGSVQCSPPAGSFTTLQNGGTTSIIYSGSFGTVSVCSLQITGAGGLGNTVTITVGTKSFAGTITEFAIPTPNSQPRGIAAGPDGNIWFVEQNGNNVGRITPSGAITEFPVTTPASTPRYITAGPDGNLWFSENQVAQIGRITPSGTVAEFPLPSGGLVFPRGITTGPDGNLWVTEPGDGPGVSKIGRVTTSGTVTEFTVPNCCFPFPQSIALGSDGNLWFTENNSGLIGRISPGGTIAELIVGACSPNGIAGGPDGNLWYEDTCFPNSTIGRLTTTGTPTTFMIPTVDAIGENITTGPDGNLWFTEFKGNKIGRITPGGTITEFTVPTGSSFPYGITVGPDGNIWFTESNKNQIGRLQ